MITALEGVRGQRHAPAAIYTRERPSTHCTGGWVDPSAGLDRCGKSRPPPGFDPRTFHPVASRYTHWAIRSTFIPINFAKFLLTDEGLFASLGLCCMELGSKDWRTTDRLSTAVRRATISCLMLTQSIFEGGGGGFRRLAEETILFLQTVLNIWAL